MPDYPSNLTKEQFEFIRPDLESFRKRTHPRTVRYTMFLMLLSMSCELDRNGVNFQTTFQSGKRFMITSECGHGLYHILKTHYWICF